jgi:hypothetical protein
LKNQNNLPPRNRDSKPRKPHLSKDQQGQDVFRVNKKGSNQSLTSGVMEACFRIVVPSLLNSPKLPVLCCLKKNSKTWDFLQKFVTYSCWLWAAVQGSANSIWDLLPECYYRRQDQPENCMGGSHLLNLEVAQSSSLLFHWPELTTWSCPITKVQSAKCLRKKGNKIMVGMNNV